MSTSLRDQLLKVGLINQQQANAAERQQQRQERRPPKQKPAAGVPRPPAVPAAPAAKVARDQALNRRQQEKAEHKARLAQIKQWIDQNALPPIEGEEFYHFVDGAKIRRIPANAAVRERFQRGELAIVRHAGRYHLVPAAIGARIRERDAHAFVTSGALKDEAPPNSDDGYAGFVVPDDLMW